MGTLWTALRALVGDHTTTRLPLGATTLLPALAPGRDFRADPLRYLRGLTKLQDVSHLHLGFSEFHLVTSPEFIRSILTTDDSRFGEGKWTQRGRFVMGDCLITREGAPHRERRSVLVPGFRSALSVAGATDMAPIVDRLTAHWRDGDELEARAAIGRIALCIAAQVLFDEDMEEKSSDALADLWILNSALSRLPAPRPRLLAARARLRKLASRMRNGPIVDHLREHGVSEDAVNDEIVSLLIASVDTTPRTIAWLWTLLAAHPTTESQLHQELDTVLDGRPMTSDDLPRLQKLDRVVSEVLRLYPPVHFVDRRALQDMDIGAQRVRAGDYILLSPLLTHRDRRYWKEPDQFRPDRWSAEDEHGVSRTAYFPFGAGPHVCIGAALAVREIMVISATLAQRWRFRAPVAEDSLHPMRSRFPLTLEART